MKPTFTQVHRNLRNVGRAARGGAAVLSVVLFCGADWLQFRGTDSNGVAREAAAPTNLSDEGSLAWKIDLEGRGLSGPIVVGDRVVLTSSSGYQQDRLHVRCFATATGQRLWERQFWATGRTMCHPKMCVATPTPSSDGKRIFAFYSSNDLACLDLNGNLLWYRGLTHDFPNASNSLGMASSPVVVGDTLVVQVENDADSFATGLDVETGVARWKIVRPKRANWTSPSVLAGKSPGEGLVLLQSSDGLAAVDPRTGTTIWTYGDGAATIPSSVVAGNSIFVPSNGLTVLRTGSKRSSFEVTWNDSRLGPSTPSLLVLGDRVYTINSAGVLVCANAESGETAWRLRLQGPLSASPVAAGDYLYFFSENGLAQVVKTGDQGSIISEKNLEEPVLCTPAIADGSLYVRTDKHLWKFAK